MTHDPMNNNIRFGKRRYQVICCGFIVGVFGILTIYSRTEKYFAQRHQMQRIDRVESRLDQRPFLQSGLDEVLLRRMQRLGPLLASWQTIGGCGAGSSVGGTGGVKWIGRNTRGGLFQAQFMTTYMPVPHDYLVSGGYNFSVTALINRDLGEKWNVGVLVPYLYKYYRDYYQLPVDVSNAGLGDINFLLTRRFGSTNATSVTASVGIPTGTHDATYKMDPLTQEKQLGLGRLNGGLMLDHTLDEIWGLIVLGGVVSYRGGQNELGNYRSPVGSLYSHIGYFLGPFVPACGLTFSHFAKRDRDRGIDQNMPLTTVAGSASLEWSNDYLAVLAGASLPLAIPDLSRQPWVVALGVSVSPF